MTQHTLVLIPVYRPVLDRLETASVDQSMAVLRSTGRPCVFIGPEGMDTGWYAERYPDVPVMRFPARFFSSIKGYNLLMLDPDFYRGFAGHDFVLILQTDAFLLHDALDHWAARPYDYIGAPWPEGMEVLVSTDRFAGPHARKVRARVGNGGLSLRRIDKCVALLQEFPQSLEVFRHTGSSEDLFFGLLGPLSLDFVMPGEVEASCFAMELQPTHYFQVNGQREPMGAHAWWKYDPAFWVSRVPSLAHALNEPTAAAV